VSNALIFFHGVCGCVRIKFEPSRKEIAKKTNESYTSKTKPGAPIYAIGALATRHPVGLASVMV
jgi:hypothetical protein